MYVVCKPVLKHCNLSGAHSPHDKSGREAATAKPSLLAFMTVSAIYHQKLVTDNIFTRISSEFMIET